MSSGIITRGYISSNSSAKSSSVIVNVISAGTVVNHIR